MYSEEAFPVWSRERLAEDEVAEQIRDELAKGPEKRMRADTDTPRRGCETHGAARDASSVQRSYWSSRKCFLTAT